jgi:hypothetical protein
LLLLGERPSDTLFLREALAPTTAAGLVRSNFACQVARFDQLATLPLSDVEAIMLVDPTPLPDEAWQALADYVYAGGGLGIFLGRHAKLDRFNEGAAQQLLPAKLRWQSRDETYLRPTSFSHPALAEMEEFADLIPWPEYTVFKYWELEPAAADVHVVAWYANGKPALLDRQLGAGRILTMTTPVSDPAHTDPWNVLPTAPDPWPFLVLAGGVADYLAGVNQTQLNYQAGQTAVIPLAPEERVASFVLQMPGGNAVRQSLAPGRSELVIAATDTLGNYRVQAGGQQGQLDRGFSINAPADVSWLLRTDFDHIAAALGENRVRIARTQEEIEVRVGLGRVGRELFPGLILAMAMVLGAESLLANRFYAK